MPSASLTSKTRTSGWYFGMSVRSEKLEAPELSGHREGALADAVELEVGLEDLVVEVVFGLLQLLGVIPPVPGLERELAAFLVGHGLELRGFLFGHRQGRRPELVEEPDDRRPGVLAMFSSRT